MSARGHHQNRAPMAQLSPAGRERLADHNADALYGEWADPDCKRCRGRGWVGGGDPCPVCALEVWS